MGALSDAIAEKKQYNDLLAKNEAEMRERANPTRNMSTGQRLLAGTGQGMTNAARQVGNMVGLVSDERMEEAKAKDAALLDTTAGTVGSFVGETAALAPLTLLGAPVAAVGKGLQLLNRARTGGKAVKALGTTLPRATGAGTQGMARAATEGAAAGAILSGPDNRMGGALTGAGGGAIMNRTVGALGRKFAQGVNKKDSANALTSEIQKLTGRKASVPLAQAAKNPKAAFVHRSGLSLFPLARGGSEKMSAKLQDDWERAILVKTFGKNSADEIMGKLDDTGSFSESARWGLNNLKGYPQNRRALEDVIRKMSKNDKLSPRNLDQASVRLSDGESRPFYDLTSSYLDVLERSLEESTVAGRNFYHKVNNMVGPMIGAAASGFSIPAYAGLTAGTMAAASRPAQKFIMGETGINSAMRGVGRIASPYAAAVRNQIAGGEQ